MRTLLLVGMLALFSGWFAYDGWIGYPEANRQEHLAQLAPDQREMAASATVYSDVTAEAESEVRAILESPNSSGREEALADLLGGPASFVADGDWYYFGPAFRFRIATSGGRPTRLVAAEACTKSSTSISWQRGLAGALGVCAVAAAIQLMRVVRTRVRLDDAGLTFNGVGPIAFESMTGLDSTRFQAKGFVDLQFDDGRLRRLRLDEYHVARFAEVLTAICERRGFDNPLSSAVSDTHS